MKKELEMEAKAALFNLVAYYGNPVTKALAGIYEEALYGFQTGDVVNACKSFLLDPEPPVRMPSPGQIIARMQKMHAQIGGGEALELEADAAWVSVRRRIRTCGPYFDPHLSPAELWAVNAIGGWARLCDAPSRDMDFLGKDFVRLYKERRKHPAVAQGARAVAALAAGRTALPETVDGIPIIDASDVIQ